MHYYYRLNYIPQTKKQVNYNDDLILDDNIFHTEDLIKSKLHWRELPACIPTKVTILCHSGHMKMRVNKKDYTISQGDVLLLPRNVLIERFEVTADYQGFWISLMKLQGNVISGNAVLYSLDRLTLAGPLHCKLNKRDCQTLEDIYHLMYNIATDTDYLYRCETVEQLFMVFNTSLVNALQQKGRMEKPKMPTRRDEIFDQFLSDVNTFYATHRDMQFYAKRQSISAHYLARTIRLASGRLAADWIRDVVILNAKVLVESGKYSMQDISRILHFPNQSGFNMYFKSAVGCSPRRYLTLKKF